MTDATKLPKSALGASVDTSAKFDRQRNAARPVSLREQRAAIEASGLFDREIYLSANPETPVAVDDPLTHYLTVGEREGRLPSFYFDPSFYGASVDDPEAAGLSLLYRYLLDPGTGSAPSIHFDQAWYLDTYCVPPGECPLVNYMKHRRERNPNPFFDVELYLRTYADLRSESDPYRHFAEWGVRAGRIGSKQFDGRFYRQKYLHADPSINPLTHFLASGRVLGFRPTPSREDVEAPLSVRYFTSPGPFFEGERRKIIAKPDVKAFAFYLPQFHPIPENDEFWGEGFTEWRNLSRGQPRFAGHYQPRIPRDLGFYNLLDRQTIRRQVQAAIEAGIFGFCYYFYYFNGRRVLEKPLDLFVEDETLSMPFCLMWANENWTRRWDGLEKDVLLRQSYNPEAEDELLDCLGSYFRSDRYFRIGGRPLLFIYRPGIIPNASSFFERLRAGIERRIGVEPIIFMGQTFGDEDPRPFGLDGAIEFPPHKVTSQVRDIANRQRILDWTFSGQVFDYEEIAVAASSGGAPEYPLIKTVLPMWDNDARRQGAGLCIHGSTPEKFSKWLDRACVSARKHPIQGERLVFLNAWNEWCEGAYLEPDVHYGWAYLNAVADGLSGSRTVSDNLKRKVLLVGHDAFAAGAQHLLMNIGRQLTNFGIEVTFYLLGNGELLERYRQIAPVVLWNDVEPHQIGRVFQEQGYTHALTNTAATGRVVPFLKSEGFRVISLIHELPSLIAAHGLEESCRAVAEHSDQVVFASAFVAEPFYNLVGTGRERAVLREQGLYSSMSPGYSRTKFRRDLGIDEGTTVILGAGYGDLRKGVDIFCEFARLMAAVDMRIHFVWVGALDPAIATWVAKDVQRAGLTNVHFLGHQDDVGPAFRAADFLFLSSREDPYPTVALEALSVGLAVVGFKGCGGFNDLIEDRDLGRTIPFGDFEAFKAAIRDLTKANKSRSARRKRTDFIREKFRWDDYCFDLSALLYPDLKKISVVVPNYNCASYIEERLSSIFSQTYPIFEVVLLDDGSTDDSLGTARSVADKAMRPVNFQLSLENSGSVLGQWKRGVSTVRGEYVWIAEADDASHPQFVARLVQKLSRARDGRMAFCDSKAIDSDGSTLFESYKGYYAELGDHGLSTDGTWPAQAFLRRFLSIRNLILNVSSVVWKTEVIREALSRVEAKEFSCAGDWRVYYESCLSGGTIAYIGEPLNWHRRHEASVTESTEKLQHYAEISAIHRLVASAFPDDLTLAEDMRKYRSRLRKSWGLSSEASREFT